LLKKLAQQDEKLAQQVEKLTQQGEKLAQQDEIIRSSVKLLAEAGLDRQTIALKLKIDIAEVDSMMA